MKCTMRLSSLPPTFMYFPSKYFVVFVSYGILLQFKETSTKLWQGLLATRAAIAGSEKHEEPTVPVSYKHDFSRRPDGGCSR